MTWIVEIWREEWNFKTEEEAQEFCASRPDDLLFFEMRRTSEGFTVRLVNEGAFCETKEIAEAYLKECLMH